jgi:glycosyltransferase involved in cell wall biosynthesis
VRSDAVVHNPVKPLYLELDPGPPRERNYVTYVGRLSVAKNLHRILPVIRDLLDETPGMRMCIIGAGEERTRLEAIIDGDVRFEFKGVPDDISVRDWLRRTKIFISGNVAEGFGITYLESLTQGCVVAMPASGGGLEISPENVGGSIQLFPLSFNRSDVLAALRRSLHERSQPVCTASFTAKAVADLYLKADSRFSFDGRVTQSLNAANCVSLHEGAQ